MHDRDYRPQYGNLSACVCEECEKYIIKYFGEDWHKLYNDVIGNNIKYHHENKSQSDIDYINYKKRNYCYYIKMLIAPQKDRDEIIERLELIKKLNKEIINYKKI